MRDLILWVTTFFFLWQSAFNISGRALAALLSFVGKFILVLARLSALPIVALLSSLFPSSLHRAKKLVGISKDSFSTYVVCGNCYSIYRLSECMKDDKIYPRRCDNLAFPDHRLHHKRIPCNAPLFRKVILPQSDFKYYQINSYPFKSLKDALERLLLRPGFARKLEAWRQRKVPNGYMCDIYDGMLWQENSDFFSNPRSLGFMLNLDWFQPFEHTTDSIGAMYLSIVNLPRQERFRKENIILLGLIPSMEHEPSCVNSFLYPIVEEFKKLWIGEI